MFDPTSDRFWDEGALKGEFVRVFDICNGCRRCYNLCPSFISLFKAIDSERVDGEAERLTDGDFHQVVNLCYQCKLCFNHCPYTPPHRFDIDFPRMMLRAKAVQAKRRGVTFQDRLLGNIDLLGWLGSITAPFSNWANRNRLNRYIMHRLLGIHKDRALPKYSRRTFARWFKGHEGIQGERGKVALFYTCFVNYYSPQVGMAVVEVLERNGVEVICPEQRCCGMPYLDGGDLKSAIKNVSFNVEHLGRAVKEGYLVIVPGPTCGYMLKHEYPLLGGTEAGAVAQSTLDICEFLMRQRERGLLDSDFKNRPGPIAYHLPCHLKAQNIGYKSMELMGLIPGAEVTLIEACSGVDGTWGLKREFFELSLKVGERLFNEMKASRPSLAVSDCPLASMQIEQATGIRPVHPVQVLKYAYGI